MDLFSGYPFWLIQKGLPYNYPALERSIQAEVIILGGGISGALAGYCLVNAGVPCVVLDGRSIGLGSTCASTSLLQYEIDTALCELESKIGKNAAVKAYKLCEKAIGGLATIAEQVACADFEFKRSLYFTEKGSHKSFLKKEFNARKAAGFNVTYLEKEEVENTFGFSTDAAILSESGAQTNAYTLTHALHQYCINKGMEVYDRSFVTSISHNKDSVELMLANGCKAVAKKLIYATGYEATQYIKKKIVRLHSTYATVSEQWRPATSFWKDEVLLWNTGDPYLYMRTTTDHRIIVGGRDELFYDAGKRDRLIGKKATQLKHDFESLFPHLEFKTEFSWTGTFGSTKDGLPYIGPIPDKANGYFALGFGGNGVTFSLVAAEMIKDMITGKKNEDAGIFSFNR